MDINTCKKETFSVIGKLGSTEDGVGFVRKLWDDANGHFNEVSALAKKDDAGKLVGIWGAMSDFSGAFHPWEDGFSKGLYLAGIEAEDGAEPPEGWVKWTIPAFEFIYVKSESPDTFKNVIKYLNENHIELAGAVQDFINPESGGEFMFFLIRKL